MCDTRVRGRSGRSEVWGFRLYERDVHLRDVVVHDWCRVDHGGRHGLSGCRGGAPDVIICEICFRRVKGLSVEEYERLYGCKALLGRARTVP